MPPVKAYRNIDFFLGIHARTLCIFGGDPDLFSRADTPKNTCVLLRVGLETLVSGKQQ